ncbi:MAG TPA: hypothetical protein VJC18_02195, partial [bacterium]|nr:hypothetical protein [bacterium]
MRHYLVIILVLCSLPALAAGPMINETTTSGEEIISTPPVWDNSAPIEYHLESGSCGPFSNEEMIEKYATDMGVWSGIDSVDLSFLGVTGELDGIDFDNYTDYFYLTSDSDESLLTDGINPIAFDDDGAITVAIFGDGNQYLLLGFAGISYYADGEVLDGQSVINCLCIVDNPAGPCVIESEAGDVTVEMTEADLDFTIVHEMGHFLNLGHTNVNSDIYMADSYSEGDIPIMFPIASGMQTITPHEDDIMSLTTLYPSGEVSDHYCVVEGHIMDSTGENYVPCVDVWAVTDDEDLTQTLSYTTASNNYFNTMTTNDFDPTGTCDANCGFFSLHIKPGTAYTLRAYDVYHSFTEASSVGPCTTEQPAYGLTGVELMTITDSDCPSATDEPIEAGEISVEAEVDSSGGDEDGGSGDSDKLDEDEKFNPIGHG